MYTESIKIKLRCPKHPRYNPTQGEGAIRGACGGCLSLFTLWRSLNSAHSIFRANREELGLEGDFKLKSLEV